MPDADLNFLARQNERILQDLASVRDELRVQGAMIMRLEGAVASLSEQVQVVHTFAEKVLSATRMGFGGHVEPGVRR
jgi:6-phosphogluconate dehydrogenase (decarboxylating)